MNNVEILIQKAIGELDQLLRDNVDLKDKVTNILEKYMNNSLWPSNFSELERALGRLYSGLPSLIKTFLIPNIDIFDPMREKLPTELNAFLKTIQENYSYKYRVAAFRTVLRGDGYNWYTVNVQGFHKNGNFHYGISIVRNDGQNLYFEGEEGTINRMIEVIQGTMEKIKQTNPGGV